MGGWDRQDSARHGPGELGGRIVCASRHSPRPTVGSEGEWLKAAKQQSSKAASSKAGKQESRASKQHSSRAANQQSSKAAEQESSKAEKHPQTTPTPIHPMSHKQ